MKLGILDGSLLHRDVEGQKGTDMNFIGCEKSFDEARVVLFGAPYDSTTSFRPGTRFGPAAMRTESFGIETYSMLIDKDLETDAAVHDSGDIELPFGCQERALEMIEARAAKILESGKIPFLLGGEHLVTLGAVRAAAKKYPDLRIIHFDAHADLREDYLGKPLSHACVLRRCHDILGDGRIFQFGIRSGTRDEREFMRQGHVTTELFTSHTLPEVVAALAGTTGTTGTTETTGTTGKHGTTGTTGTSDTKANAIEQSPNASIQSVNRLIGQSVNTIGQSVNTINQSINTSIQSIQSKNRKIEKSKNSLPPVYLTIDMDVLDPSEFPGTGTQEAGGFSYQQLVEDMRAICERLNVVAIDNVELNPGLDATGRSTALACKFLREELLSLR